MTETVPNQLETKEGRRCHLSAIFQHFDLFVSLVKGSIVELGGRKRGLNSILEEGALFLLLFFCFAHGWMQNPFKLNPIKKYSAFFS
jgi:hypothetical protein